MRFLAISAVIAVLAASSSHAEQTIDFNRDVRPILAGNCLKCHGIDEAARKSKLRLDLRETATAPAKSGKLPIVPGKPEASELVHRVFSNDPDERMPPASTHIMLSDAQKKVLREWIAQGAKYETHWAFVAPRQTALPKVAQENWPRNAIDYFIAAKLESQGLHPLPEADRYTLVRRLYLDLIGLPPPLAEADEFVSNPASDAYEKLVDKLLANPHYGERWARRWLDLARYADTNGFEKDRPRTIWPYRDWVINAFNADMPFDQFTIEQIAGDMLPHATTQQKIATGFHRNTMLNEEGGIDPLEYRFYASVDRIDTTGTAWLGLTVRCAQCHTHKFDPITHKEYYQLMAFLDNADEPQLELHNRQVDRSRQKTEAKITKLVAALPEKWPGEEQIRTEAVNNAFAMWETSAAEAAVRWTPLRPVALQSSLPYLTAQSDDSIVAGGDIAKSTTYDLAFRPQLRRITAIRLEALPDDSLPGHGPGMTYYEGENGDFFLSTISLSADGQQRKFFKAAQTFGSPAAGAIDSDPQTGWAITGGTGKLQAAVFSLREPVEDVKDLSLHMLFERYFAAPLGHFRVLATDDPHAASPQAFPDEIERILLIGRATRSATQEKQLFDYFLTIAPELAGARKEIEKLRQSEPPVLTTLVMRERPPGHSRQTFVHHRGEFLQTDEAVEPGIPAFLPQLPKGAPANRLSFARWLVSRDNPLTARVQVNRQWAAFFGRGIVRTVQDFGYQGEPPSNQELLDWLAVEFMKQGWSLKKLDRLIVTSATYRQSSNVTPDLLARDPENALLARGPRFRLEAELIRDSSLKAAGLLSERIGGPSVFPPQPASVTTEGAYGALKWKASTGEDRYRRSLYTFSKRTAPFALYQTFDAPAGDVCVAQRDVSNSPLQALSLLNDTVFMEAAQAIGDQCSKSAESDEAKVTEIFRRFLVRPPDAQELPMLVDFVRHQRQRFEKDDTSAAKVAGSASEDAAERACWTALARAVMNLDESVTKQ